MWIVYVLGVVSALELSLYAIAMCAAIGEALVRGAKKGFKGLVERSSQW